MFSIRINRIAVRFNQYGANKKFFTTNVVRKCKLSTIIDDQLKLTNKVNVITFEYKYLLKFL